MIEYTVKVYEDGTKFWYLNGKLHREDGPAIELANDNKFWYLNGKCHREDGPAIEYANGTKHWFLNGEYHREDGPAIEQADGTKFWYLNGENLTQEEHQSATNPAKEYSVAEIEKLLGHRVKIVK
jgi:hypothetical protein